MLVSTHTTALDILSSRDFLPGQYLHDRYRIIRHLGQGGFGETYVALDTQHPDQPQCVVKRLKPLTQNQFSSLEERRRRFNREVQALKNLGQHDQIPQFLAHFEENEEFYLVQEFIDGQSLEQELEAENQRNFWTEQQVLQLLWDVLNILNVVHEQRLIHRDVKPSNLIRRQQDDRFVLIDFGSVASIPQEPDPSRASQPNTVAIHSEGYTPMEQLRGQPCPASDLYALGMIAIQALTGLHPRHFEESLHLGEITWFKDTQASAKLVAVLITMTRRNWKDRYQTASEILNDLQELTDCLPLATLQPAVPSPKATVSADYTPTQLAAPLAQEASVSQLIPNLLEVSVVNRRSSTKITDTKNPSQRSQQAVERKPKADRWSSIAKALSHPRLLSCLMGTALISTGVGLFLWLVIGLGTKDKQPHAVDASPVPVKFLLNTLTGYSPVETITFADEQTLIGGGADSTAVSWDVAIQQPIQTFANHFSSITAVAVSPDSQVLATGSQDTNINLWNLRTGEVLHTLRGHLWSVLALTFSPDGQTLVSSSEDNTVKVWDVKTGKLRNTLTGFKGVFRAVDISLDGLLLAGGNEDHTIVVWNLHTQELVRVLKGHADAVHSVAIASNSAILASGSADHTVKVWNLYTGELLHTLEGHTAEVRSVAISPNGQFVVSGSADKTVKVWQLHTGRLIHTFRDHTSDVYSVSVSQDGQILASASLDGTVKVWQMPNETSQSYLGGS